MAVHHYIIACHGDNIDVVIYLVNAMSKYLPLKDVAGCRGRDGQTPLHECSFVWTVENSQIFYH